MWTQPPSVSWASTRCLTLQIFCSSVTIKVIKIYVTYPYMLIPEIKWSVLNLPSLVSKHAIYKVEKNPAVLIFLKKERLLTNHGNFQKLLLIFSFYTTYCFKFRVLNSFKCICNKIHWKPLTCQFSSLFFSCYST